MKDTVEQILKEEKGSKEPFYDDKTNKDILSIGNIDVNQSEDYYKNYLSNINRDIDLEFIITFYNTYIKHNKKIEHTDFFLQNMFHTHLSILWNVDAENLEDIIQAWIHDLDDIKKIKSVLMYENRGNLKSLLDAGIKDSWELLQLKGLIIRVHNNILKLILNTGIIKISELKELEFIMSLPKFEEIKILINAGITNTQDLVKLEEVIIKGKKENIEYIIKNTENKWNLVEILNNLIYFLYYNSLGNHTSFELKGDDYIYNLDIWNKDLFKYGQEITKYRNNPKSLYPTSHPFSVPNIKSNIQEYGQRNIWVNIKGNEKMFYTTMGLVDPEVQLVINRLFSPYIWMTRLVRIQAPGKKLIASMDVNDEYSKDILWYKENTAQNIKDLLRIIYQFIAWDRDRNSEHNMENDIIYDFDRILSIFKFTIETDSPDLDFDREQYKEIAKIIYFFKSYMYQYAQEELRLLKENNTLDNELEDIWEYISIKSLRLNMVSLLLWTNSTNLISAGIGIDKEIKKMDDYYSQKVQ